MWLNKYDKEINEEILEFKTACGEEMGSAGKGFYIQLVKNINNITQSITINIKNRKTLVNLE